VSRDVFGQLPVTACHRALEGAAEEGLAISHRDHTDLADGVLVWG
jgi:hypothetical protein